jgi:AraC family transcriptional regulator of arabinose operon
MIINNAGFNFSHDVDFYVERKNGSGDYLLLLLKTGAYFNLNGRERLIPENSVILFKKGTPQYYRCIPKHIFTNDWIHFDFENESEKEILCNIPFDKPIKVNDMHFLSFCIKMISSEFYSNNKNKNKNILSYMTLIFSKIDEEKSAENKMKADKKNEALSMIRRKIYEKPYENRTIKDTSHELRMSESLFQHAYKEQFGISFVKDLINSRIEYAKMLLINTNINANDISVMCGYKNYVHFSRQFTKNVGLSPLNYRMQNKL